MFSDNEQEARSSLLLFELFTFGETLLGREQGSSPTTRFSIPRCWSAFPIEPVWVATMQFVAVAVAAVFASRVPRRSTPSHGLTNEPSSGPQTSDGVIPRTGLPFLSNSGSRGPHAEPLNCRDERSKRECLREHVTFVRGGFTMHQGEGTNPIWRRISHQLVELA